MTDEIKLIIISGLLIGAAWVGFQAEPGTLAKSISKGIVTNKEIRNEK